jgi:hypothetical protein
MEIQLSTVFGRKAHTRRLVRREVERRSANSFVHVSSSHPVTLRGIDSRARGRNCANNRHPDCTAQRDAPVLTRKLLLGHSTSLVDGAAGARTQSDDEREEHANRADGPADGPAAWVGEVAPWNRPPHTGSTSHRWRKAKSSLLSRGCCRTRAPQAWRRRQLEGGVSECVERACRPALTQGDDEENGADGGEGRVPSAHGLVHGAAADERADNHLESAPGPVTPTATRRRKPNSPRGGRRHRRRPVWRRCCRGSWQRRSRGRCLCRGSHHPCTARTERARCPQPAAARVHLHDFWLKSHGARGLSDLQ